MGALLSTIAGSPQTASDPGNGVPVVNLMTIAPISDLAFGSGAVFQNQDRVAGVARHPPLAA